MTDTRSVVLPSDVERFGRAERVLLVKPWEGDQDCAGGFSSDVVVCAAVVCLAALSCLVAGLVALLAALP